MISDHLEFKKSFFERRQPHFTDNLAKDAPRTYPWWTEQSVSRAAQPAKPPGSKM